MSLRARRARQSHTIKCGFDESNPYSLLYEIASLPSVARNDNRGIFFVARNDNRGIFFVARNNISINALVTEANFYLFLNRDDSSFRAGIYTHTAVYTKIPVYLDAVFSFNRIKSRAFKKIEAVVTAVAVISYLHFYRIFFTHFWVADNTRMSGNDRSYPSIFSLGVLSCFFQKFY
jgi:hypothetical protein